MFAILMDGTCLEKKKRYISERRTSNGDQFLGAEWLASLRMRVIHGSS